MIGAALDVVNTGQIGTVYLIHFDQGLESRPGVYARHYVGWAKDLDARLEHHRKGRGSPLIAALAARGIGWRVVRTWRGDRNLERAIKNRREAPRFCPCCVREGRTRRGLLDMGAVESGGWREAA